MGASQWVPIEDDPVHYMHWVTMNEPCLITKKLFLLLLVPSAEINPGFCPMKFPPEHQFSVIVAGF